jgi:hypothetical protein
MGHPHPELASIDVKREAGFFTRSTEAPLFKAFLKPLLTEIL